MPRGGGASAAHQQGTAPAHPGGQWTPVASSSLNVARASHAGASINDSIFVLGGWPDSQFTRALTDVERLDKTGDPWQLLPALATGRGNPAAAALNGRLYAIGGYSPQDALTSVEAIEPGKDPAWSPVAGLPERRGACAAAATRDRVYVTGGDDGTTAHSLKTLLVYDQGTNQWQAKAPMTFPRSNHKMVYLDPYIYAIGGIDAAGGPVLSTVERYDPGNNTWTTVAPMNTGRINVGTAVVGNQIVVVGGLGGPDFGHLRPLQTSEIYDPAADAWTTFDPLLNPGRGGVTSATVQGNRVLAIGGAFSTAQGFVTTKEVDRSPNVRHRN